MNFNNKKPGKRASQILSPRCLIVLQNKSRFFETHGISARKTDNILGEIERFLDKSRYESVSNQLLSLREKIEGDASPINKITEYLLNCS